MSTEFDKPKKPKTSYLEADYERGLLALALCAGSVRKASKQTGIPFKTLDRWKVRLADRYEQIQADVVPRLHAQLAAEAEAAAFDAMDAQRLALELTRTQLNTGEIKDASTATRNLATVAGIMTDKAALLRGRPTAIIEQRNTDEILNSMAAKLQRLTGQTINSTAIDDDTPQITEAVEAPVDAAQ